MCGCSWDTHRLGVERGLGRNDDTTAAVLYCTLHGLTGGGGGAGLMG